MRRTLPILLLGPLLTGVSAGAQQQVTATLNANLPPLVRLSLSTNTITFPDADPDRVLSIPSSPPSVTITAKARASIGSTVTLTIEATDDLRSGLDTIPVSTVSWTATGPGFVSGTLSRTGPQVLATWGGSGTRSGDQSFAFANRWNYATGIYTVTIVYTLSAP
jgi:hypothetical protein